jgi:hypothetical protein
VNPVPILHGVVITNEISQHSIRECLSLTNVFSDSAKRISHSLFYGSLENTRFWFQDESHILQCLKQSEVLDRKRIIFGENLIHAVFFGLLTAHNGVQFANKNSLQIKRMLKLVTWKQWTQAAQQFVTFLNISSSERKKHISDLSKFAIQMQELRVAKPYFMPTQIDKNDLSVRFGCFVANMWMEWSNREIQTWVLNNNEISIQPEDFSASSDEILPNNSAIALSEVADVARETFFKSVEKISTLNTPFNTNGILDFTCRLHANNNVCIETDLHLAAPLSARHKHSEHVFHSCSNLISKSAKKPPCEQSKQGVHHVPEVAWVERIEIIPRGISIQPQSSFFLFETDDASKSKEIRESLLLKEIGNVFTPTETEHNTLFALAQRTENFIRFRSAQNFSFTKNIPVRVVFSKTEGERDFFQVLFANNKNIFWMSASTKQRSKPFHQREPLWHGFCGALIEDVAKQ